MRVMRQNTVGKARCIAMPGCRLSVNSIHRPYIYRINDKSQRFREGDVGSSQARTVEDCQQSSTACRAVSPEACLQFVRDSIDPIVFASTASASFKLFLICAIVRWLSETKRIPSNTSVVLAKVSFQVLIPCMLFSKVVSTLAMQPDPILLIGMAAAAIVQILLGLCWGNILTVFIDGQYSKSFRIFGWHASNPNDGAVSVAEATSQAMGVPHAREALLPKPIVAPAGYKSLIAAAGGFGNSFTLPAVFLLSLLPPVVADKAVAYLGLFLLAWSPCLWSFGLYSIQRGYEMESQQVSDKRGGGEMPKNQGFSLSKMVSGAINPPVIAVFAAALLGFTSVGQILFTDGGIAAVASTLPLELSLVFYGIQNAYEVIQMLGGGTLAIQTLVLAASLVQNNDEPTSKPSSPGPVKSLLSALTPDNVLEARSLAVIFIVRFILVPCTSLLAFSFLAKTKNFGPLLADPIFLFVVAVQSVMPSAQNLIIALQLSPKTQSDAPGFARLLLKLYAAAVIPVTLWVTGFASRLAIPLA